MPARAQLAFDDKVRRFRIASQRGKVYFPEIKLKESAITVGIKGNAYQHSVAVHKLSLRQCLSERPWLRLNKANAAHSTVVHICDA